MEIGINSKGTANNEKFKQNVLSLYVFTQIEYNLEIFSTNIFVFFFANFLFLHASCTVRLSRFTCTESLMDVPTVYVYIKFMPIFNRGFISFVCLTR